MDAVKGDMAVAVVMEEDAEDTFTFTLYLISVV